MFKNSVVIFATISCVYAKTSSIFDTFNYSKNIYAESGVVAATNDQFVATNPSPIAVPPPVPVPVAFAAPTAVPFDVPKSFENSALKMVQYAHGTHYAPPFAAHYTGYSYGVNDAVHSPVDAYYANNGYFK